MRHLVYSCFCCSLTTGVLVIATVEGVFSLLRLVLAVGSFIIVQLDAWRPMSYYSYDDYMTHRLRKDVYYFSRLCMFPISVKIFHALISLTANILLFLTVIKKQRYYLLPWLIISMLDNILIALALVIGLGVMTYLIDFRIDFKEVMWIYLLIIFFISVLWWYMWAIVYSYYEELRLNQRSDEDNLANESKSPPPPYLNHEQKNGHPLTLSEYQYYFKDEALV